MQINLAKPTAIATSETAAEGETAADSEANNAGTAAEGDEDIVAEPLDADGESNNATAAAADHSASEEGDII